MAFNGGKSQTNTWFLGLGDYPFLNLLKEANSWTTNDNTSAPITPNLLDANGYPTTILYGGVKVALKTPTQAGRPGNYCITWDGTGQIGAGAGGVQLGSTSFTGTISGTTLTVSALTGTIQSGQLVAATGIAPYTIIMAQLSGSAGAAGTYTVSVSQTLGSRAMTSSGGSVVSSGGANAGFYSCSVVTDTFNFSISAIGSSSNYISNVKIFHVDDAALLLAGNVFGQKFKQRLQEANFGVIRFLDWQLANATNVTNWASRKPISYAYYSGFEARLSLYGGVTTNVGAAYSLAAPTGWLGTTAGKPQDKQMVTGVFNVSNASACTLKITGGAGGDTNAINILDQYTLPLAAPGNSYPVGGTFQSMFTVVYDATLNAWIKQGGDNTGSMGIQNAVPPELMLQLCSEVGAHPYFITPTFTIDPATDYMPSLAMYCRDNAPAWMIPRYEATNETWNNIFIATNYAGSKANAYKVVDPTHWPNTGDYHNWYGKALSVLGQIISAVYSGNRTRYQVLCGVQTVYGDSLPNAQSHNNRLSSAAYISQTAAAQSALTGAWGTITFTKTAALAWTTHVVCAQYINPADQDTAAETTKAAEYAGGDLTAPARYVATINSPTGGFFTLPKLLVMYNTWKTWAQSFSIQKMCGYEGCYSPDYGGNTQVNNLRKAGKNEPTLQGFIATNLNQFVGLTDGSFTAEFPSNYLLGGGNAVWPILDPDIYVTVNPPQWLAHVAFNTTTGGGIIVMAQNAFTVTQANPTPPTNLSYVGNTPPLDPAQAYIDDGIAAAVPNSRLLTPTNVNTLNEPAGALTAFAVKVAAANTVGAPGAGVSVDHEGRGAEVPLSVTSTLQSGATWTTTWVVLNPPAYSSNPNATHASSLSAVVTSTLTGVTGASNVSGTGTTSLTATGTLFNRSSVLYVNGVAQNTQYVSPTSLTVATASKKLTAGTLPCYVITNGGQTSTVNWTLT